MKTKARTKNLSMCIAGLFITVACIQGYRNIGLPPVIIVGGSGIIGFLMWYRTYLKAPIDPKVILPLFLLTVAALEVHMAEEYLTGFGPAMSRLFGISWTERAFLMIFAFIGPGVAEFTHFIFPLLKPSLIPMTKATISQTVNNTYVADMHNYWFKVSQNQSTYFRTSH